jgi:hypothetical protein
MPFESFKFWKSPEKGGKKEEIKSAEEIAKEVWEGKEQKEKPKTPEEVALATIDKMAKRERLKNIGKSLVEAITGIGISAVGLYLMAPALEYHRIEMDNPGPWVMYGFMLSIPALFAIARSIDKYRERKWKLREKVEKAKERVLEALKERKIER